MFLWRLGSRFSLDWPIGSRIPGPKITFNTDYDNEQQQCAQVCHNALRLSLHDDEFGRLSAQDRKETITFVRN